MADVLILSLTAALCAGGAIFYLVQAWSAWRVESTKTQIEKRREQIDREARKANRKTLPERIAEKARATGWEGDAAPLVLAAAGLYLAVNIVMQVLGVATGLAAFLSLPGSVLVALAFANSSRRRRQNAFNRQLMQALDLFSAQLKGGLSPVRAIEQVLPSLPQPLRGEFAGALEQHRAARSLGDALDQIRQKYPSRAMQMLVVTVRIDEERGGKMADALEQAAENVRRDFELGAEAQAELSQEKGQFYGIVAILGLFAFFTIGRADATAKEAYTSPTGLLVLGGAFANAMFGIYRVLRVFGKAKGEI